MSYKHKYSLFFINLRLKLLKRTNLIQLVYWSKVSEKSERETKALSPRLKTGGGILGLGCGAVDRAVASDTRDPRFESRHRQCIYLSIAF